MGRKEELLAKLRNNPKNVKFADLDKLLQWYGFECRSPRRGSHYVYKRRGCRPLTIPFNRPVKEPYVKKALASIEECGDPEDP